METYSQVIAYLVTQHASHCHDQDGKNPKLMMSMDTVKAVTELSIVLGKMEVYSDKEETENYELMEQHFLNKCEEFDIDMIAFDEWSEYQPEQEDGQG